MAEAPTASTTNAAPMFASQLAPTAVQMPLVVPAPDLSPIDDHQNKEASGIPGNLRTLEQIEQERELLMYTHGVHFDPLFPTEMCDDVDTLYEKLKKYASDKSTGGGSHGCKKSGLCRGVAAAPPEECFATEAKRQEALNKVFIPVCELASKSLASTKRLDKYMRTQLRKLSLSDSGTTNQVVIPNPLKVGRGQNQPRHENRDHAPGSRKNKKAGKEDKKKRDNFSKQEKKNRQNKHVGV
jgi:hypothetical protein